MIWSFFVCLPFSAPIPSSPTIHRTSSAKCSLLLSLFLGSTWKPNTVRLDATQQTLDSTHTTSSARSSQIWLPTRRRHNCNQRCLRARALPLPTRSRVSSVAKFFPPLRSVRIFSRAEFASNRVPFLAAQTRVLTSHVFTPIGPPSQHAVAVVAVGVVQVVGAVATAQLRRNNNKQAPLQRRLQHRVHPFFHSGAPRCKAAVCRQHIPPTVRRPRFLRASRLVRSTRCAVSILSGSRSPIASQSLVVLCSQASSMPLLWSVVVLPLHPRSP